MTIYTRLLTHISGWEETWPELYDLAKGSISHNPDQWLLPLATASALGASAETVFPVIQALAFAQMSILLVDDMLDEDPRGPHHWLGVGPAANMALALQAHALEMAFIAPWPVLTRSAVADCLNRMLWDTAFGQYLDAQNPTDEASYWRVVAAKSGPYFRCAFEAAALACQAAPGQVQSLAAFGHTYGELVQLNDDLHDCMEIPANPDWFTGRMPLLFLFAEQVDHPDRQRFIDLRPQVSDPACLEEAQTILVRCGAASYAVHHILKRCHSARHLAESLPYPTPLIDLLDKMEQPILALLHTASS